MNGSELPYFQPMAAEKLLQKLDQMLREGQSLPSGQYAVMLHCDAHTACLYPAIGSASAEVLDDALRQHHSRGRQFIDKTLVYTVGVCSNPDCPGFGVMGIEAGELHRNSATD